MNRVLNRAGWIAAGVLALLLVAALGGVVFGGPLDPPSSPGSTQPQVEPRSPIPPAGWNGTFPITISQPGSYFLTRNLAGVSGQDGISITSDNVTLDLNGFTLAGGTATLNNAITAVTQRNIVARNGIIRGWYFGIYAPNTVGSTFEDLHVEQNAGDGLDIGSGNSVTRVESRYNRSGIVINQISDNWGSSVDHSNFSRNTYGMFIGANNVMVRNCVIDSNGTVGVYVTGSWNDIQDSRIVGNGGTGSSYGVNLPSGANVNLIAHNFIAANVPGNASDNGSGNRVGPADSTATSSQPWSNVEY